ncbi:hypothetical protein H6758_05260 [Candidatus Nomurabacteria bacterium]|nr:hypothetical protein [Candidatus Nomurabacteria bacterium]
MDTFFEVLEKIQDLQSKKSLVFVGISGLGGSGKSTIAEKIAQEFEKVTQVCVDHFYLPPEQRGQSHDSDDIISNCFDWDRLEYFLDALGKPGCCTRYQKYNWNTEKLDQWVNIPPDGLVLVEGIYCLQDRLIDKYDLTIWVDAPEEVRFQRSIQRDLQGRFKGKSEQEVIDMWKEIWIPQDRRYYEAFHPDQKADMIVSTQ